MVLVKYQQIWKSSSQTGKYTPTVWGNAKRMFRLASSTPFLHAVQCSFSFTMKLIWNENFQMYKPGFAVGESRASHICWIWKWWGMKNYFCFIAWVIKPLIPCAHKTGGIIAPPPESLYARQERQSCSPYRAGSWGKDNDSALRYPAYLLMQSIS